MTLVFIESALFFLIMFFVIYFKVLSKPKLGEDKIGPFRLLYLKNAGSTWTTAQKIKEVRKYLKEQGITADIYVCMYTKDPSKVRGPVVSIVGAVLEPGVNPEIRDPYASFTMPERYVAYAENENKVIGLNTMFLYPRLHAYMDLMNYTPDSENIIELYYMSPYNKGFGKGFQTRVCCKVRSLTDQEIENKKDEKPLDPNQMIFGKKSGFGRRDSYEEE